MANLWIAVNAVYLVYILLWQHRSWQALNRLAREKDALDYVLVTLFHCSVRLTVEPTHVDVECWVFGTDGTSRESLRTH